MKALLALAQAFLIPAPEKNLKLKKKLKPNKKKNSTLGKQFLSLPKAKTQEKKTNC